LSVDDDCDEDVADGDADIDETLVNLLFRF